MLLPNRQLFLIMNPKEGHFPKRHYKNQGGNDLFNQTVLYEMILKNATYLTYLSYNRASVLMFSEGDTKEYPFKLI